MAFYGAFWYQLKLLPCKKTQKVNKQKFRCKNSKFVLVVRMSWTRYYIYTLISTYCTLLILVKRFKYCWLTRDPALCSEYSNNEDEQNNLVQPEIPTTTMSTNLSTTELSIPSKTSSVALFLQKGMELQLQFYDAPAYLFTFISIYFWNHPLFFSQMVQVLPVDQRSCSMWSKNAKFSSELFWNWATWWLCQLINANNNVNNYNNFGNDNLANDNLANDNLANNRGTSILGEVRNREISGVTQ